jgi:hypothetical protein
LIVFPSGAYDCIKHSGEAQHRRRIQQLAGDRRRSNGRVGTVVIASWRKQFPALGRGGRPG